MSTASTTVPPRHILVVEDTDLCAEAFDLALSRLPATTLHFAHSAEAALCALERVPVSALITDINLPGISGLDLIVRLRSQARFMELPIVVISGEPDPAIPAQSIRLGADAFFSKPFSPAAVRRKLEELLHLRDLPVNENEFESEDPQP